MSHVQQQVKQFILAQKETQKKNHVHVVDKSNPIQPNPIQSNIQPVLFLQFRPN